VLLQRKRFTINLQGEGPKQILSRWKNEAGGVFAP
jgi:hypothetical protein